MYTKRLKELRTENRLIMEDVGKILGISISTYSGYENGNRKPSLHTITTLAKYYNVSTDYILGLTNERDPKSVEENAYEYLQKDYINWNGVPLTDRELKPIIELLEMVVRDRLPYHQHTQHTEKKQAFYV